MWQTWPDHWTDRLFCPQGNSAGRACCSRGPVKHWPVSSTDWPVHGIPVACDVTVPRDNSFTLHVVVTRHVATASDASDALGGGCQATIIRGDKTYVWTTPIRQCCHLWQWISSLLRSAVRPTCTLLGDSLTIPVMVVAVTNWSSHEPLWSSLWTQWLAGAISGCCFQVKSLGICHGLWWLWNETICGTTEALSDSALLTQAVPWFAGYKAIHLLHYSTAMLYVWCGQSLDLCSRLIGW